MNNTFSSSPLAERLAQVIEQINLAQVIYWKTQGFAFNSPPKTMVENVGARYVKLSNYRQHPPHVGEYIVEAVHSFVDTRTGNLLKAASYKAPDTKSRVRGNIADADILTKITPQGVIYLTGWDCYPTVDAILKHNP